MLRFAADLTPRYTASAQQQRPGLWTVIIIGEGHETLLFRDVEGSIEDVLRNAQMLAASALRSRGIPFSGPLSWTYMKTVCNQRPEPLVAFQAVDGEVHLGEVSCFEGFLWWRSTTQIGRASCR